MVEGRTYTKRRLICVRPVAAWAAASTPSPPLGAERVGVRWGTLAGPTYCLQHASAIFHHLIVPEPENAIAESAKSRGACGVLVLLQGVLTAINLDDKLLLRTGEIRDVTADRMLAAEFPGQGAFPQGTPQDSLRIGGVATKFARGRCAWPKGHLHESPTSPRPSPPHRGGEGAEDCGGGREWRRMTPPASAPPCRRTTASLVRPSAGGTYARYASPSLRNGVSCASTSISACRAVRSSSRNAAIARRRPGFAIQCAE